MDESTVAVNFVAQTQNALSGISSLERALYSLGKAGAAIGVAAAVTFGAYKIGQGLNEIVMKGQDAEMRLTQLATAFNGLVKPGQEGAAALDLYNKGVAFANVTPFQTGETIDAITRLRISGYDPLAKSIEVTTAKGQQMRSAMEILGDAASMNNVPIGELMQGFTKAAAGGAGLDDVLARLKMSFPKVQQELSGIARGSEEYKKKLLEIIGNMKAFQGGMEKMSGTLQGIKSNIEGTIETFITSIADVTNESTGFYAKVKGIFKGVADWMGQNTEQIMAWGKIIGYTLAYIIDLVGALLYPIKVVIQMVAQYIESFGGRLEGAMKQVGSGLNQAEAKTQAIAVLVERVTLYISLVFTWLIMKIKAFWGALASVMKFLGIDFIDVLKMVGLYLAVMAASHIPALIASLFKLTFTMQNLSRVGIFLIISQIIVLTQHWNELTGAQKVLHIALLALGVAFWVIANGGLKNMIFQVQFLALRLTTEMIPAVTGAVRSLIVYGQAMYAHAIATGRAAAGSVIRFAASMAGGFVSAIGTAIKFIRSATIVQWLWNAAMLANPIGLVVLAVAAFIAWIVGLVMYIRYLLKHWDDMSIKLKALAVVIAFVVFGPIGALIAVTALIIKNWDKVKAWFTQFFGMLGRWLSGIVDSAKSKFFAVVDAVKGFFMGLWDGLMSFIQPVVDFITSIIDGITNKFRAVKDFFVGIFSGDKNVSVSVSQPMQRRAAGGRVEPYKPYIVGDGGREEVFVPGAAGYVLPNVPRNMQRQGTVINSPVTINVNAPGARKEDADAIAEAIKRRLSPSMADMTRNWAGATI